MENNDLQHICIVGSGLAAAMSACALRKALPKKIRISVLKPSVNKQSDYLYGSVTSPQAYKFNLELGISEPDIILNTSSTFSFGTRYVDWGQHKKQWMQCFHLPFHAENGVYFHHYMTRHKALLTDYLISAQAALAGTFAHPPESNPKSALSRAEYGYHFDPSEWAKLWFNYFDSQYKGENIEIINADITDVKHDDQNIVSLQLSSQQRLKADFYIDCTGTESTLFSNLSQHFEVQREIAISVSREAAQQTGPAYRQIQATESGWRSITPLQDAALVMSLQEKLEGVSANEAHYSYKLGHRSKAWVGNCIGVGHAAYAFEPITAAPYMLLQKDITRLLELIPVSTHMQLESKEYNRRYCNDIEHTELFHKALYYENRDVGFTYCDKLKRKLTQFSHRGVFATFDLEPFNEEDWAILHAGLGRVPAHYDKLADQISMNDMQAKLSAMKNGIAHMAKQMPPHHIYIQKFKQYLRENHG